MGLLQDYIVFKPI